MAYEDNEISVSDGNPIELYVFRMGGTTWRFTSGNIPVTYDTNIYLPSMVGRGKLTQTAEVVKNELSVELHRSNAFAQQFIAYPPEQNIGFTLYRGHDGDFVTYWIGNVSSFTFGVDSIKLTIIPPHRGGTMSALRRKYQINCTYPLYSPECKIVQGSWSVAGVIATISGKTVTAAAFASKPNGWFNGGKIVAGTTERLIVAHTTTTIRTVLQMPLVSADDAFLAYAGCPHSYSACGSKFNNKINYGGQPWLPDKNPFVGDSVQ